MASYSIQWGNSTKKDLRNLQPQQAEQVLEAVKLLAEDPQPRGSKKLVGFENTYRIRVGDYRVIYDILNVVLIVLVQRVRHRKDVYRK